MNEEEYKKSLSILIDVLSKTRDTNTMNTTIIENIDSLYTSRKLKLIFVELTDITIIDSFFCSYIEQNCYKADMTKKSIPIFYIYAPLEKIGNIPNFCKLIEDYNKRNDIHVLAMENIATIIKLYGIDIRNIMKNIPYGLIFQTNNEKNMKYTQKLLSDSNIPNLMEQILVNPKYCILYRNPIKTSVEQKLSDEEDNPEETNNNSDSNSKL